MKRPKHQDFRLDNVTLYLHDYDGDVVQIVYNQNQYAVTIETLEEVLIKLCQEKGLAIRA